MLHWDTLVMQFSLYFKVLYLKLGNIADYKWIGWIFFCLCPSYCEHAVFMFIHFRFKCTSRPLFSKPRSQNQVFLPFTSLPLSSLLLFPLHPPLPSVHPFCKLLSPKSQFPMKKTRGLTWFWDSQCLSLCEPQELGELIVYLGLGSVSISLRVFTASSTCFVNSFT